MSSAASSPVILVNGTPDDRVSALDRGFTLGDGLFETIAVRDGRSPLWQEHMERLTEGCRRLALPAPDPGELALEADRARADGADGTIRVSVTRGQGERGYKMPSVVEPTRVVAWFPGVPTFPRDALVLRWCETRLSENPVLAGMKHLNRLEQVLARSEWDDDDIDEGVMRTVGGDVVECTSCNLFLVRDGVLVTPDLSASGVAGVVRRRVIELAMTLGVSTQVTRIAPNELLEADELFVTNVTRGIAPVASLADRSWPAPGALTARIRDAFRESLQ